MLLKPLSDIAAYFRPENTAYIRQIQGGYMRVKLSPRFGVNPSVTVCPICMIDTGLALLGRLPGDEEAPRSIRGPTACPKCIELMGIGVLLVEVNDRIVTGRQWVVTERAGRALNIPGRVAYISTGQVNELGLDTIEPLMKG